MWSGQRSVGTQMETTPARQYVMPRMTAAKPEQVGVFVESTSRCGTQVVRYVG